MILWLVGLLWAAPMDFSGCRGDAAVAATARYEDMVRTGDPAVELGFADCLARLGLLHAAQRHYLMVVRRGPDAEGFQPALGRAFALAEEIGDLRSVSPYVRGLSIRDFPARPGRNALLFVHGRQLAWQDETVLAVGTLDEIDPEFRWAEDAKLISGRINERAGRAREALDTYRSVESGPRMAEARMLEARLLLEQGEPERALSALLQVPATAERAADAIATRTRLWLSLGDAKRAREDAALVASIGREAGGLAVADLATLEVDVAECRVGPARRGIQRFERRWGRAGQALDAVALVGDPGGLAVWETWFGSDPVRWELPRIIHSQVAYDGLDKAFLRAHLNQITLEREVLASVEDETFTALVSPHLSLLLDDGEQVLQSLMGAAHQSHLTEVASELGALLSGVDSLELVLRRCQPELRDG